MKSALPPLPPLQSIPRKTRLAFIHDTLQELLPLVRAEGCELLIYLLKMAKDQALLESVRDIDGPRPSAPSDEPQPLSVEGP